MNPRLNSSKKWTAFPQEYTDQIASVFKEAFSARLQESKLFVNGRIYPMEILLQVGYLEPKRLKQNNFELSISYRADKDKVVELIHLGVDAIASIMQEFFESEGELDLPLTWKEFDFNKRSVFLQYTTVNTELEAQADALLGVDQDQLVKEEDDAEDALDQAEIADPELLEKSKKTLH